MICDFQISFITEGVNVLLRSAKRAYLLGIHTAPVGDISWTFHKGCVEMEFKQSSPIWAMLWCNRKQSTWFGLDSSKAQKHKALPTFLRGGKIFCHTLQLHDTRKIHHTEEKLPSTNSENLKFPFWKLWYQSLTLWRKNEDKALFFFWSLVCQSIIINILRIHTKIAYILLQI